MRLNNGYMKTKVVIGLPLTAELQRAIRGAAKETRLSQAELMRQSIQFGLPIVRERLAAPAPARSSAKNAAK